ncbi:hypothetical protein LTR86_010947 [Recurvomyces mirabilis]|nr:hypothetical protein LTR86_010947 [Recurvomyces mirabilis]
MAGTQATSSYTPPLALTIVSSISIGIAALVALWVLIDIILRRGWKSMMAVMIPVYVINALYLWPITLWTYLNFGRPPKRQRGQSMPSHCAHHPPHAGGGEEADKEHSTVGGSNDHEDPVRPEDTPSGGEGFSSSHDPESASNHGHSGHEHGDHGDRDDEHGDGNEHGGHSHHYGGGTERPMFATVTVAVCHCGAGCVLSDIIGEWIVYGANATINGRTLWVEYLIDFAFAIVIGVVFQYFSIAPMASEYGPKIFYRAAKADFFSLLFFEIGLFGWMAIFQVAIFHWRLQMGTVTYWFMMQVFSSLHLMNCTCDITLTRSRADWDVPWALDWSAD